MGNRMQFYVTWWPKEGHKPPGRRQRIELNVDIGALVELTHGGLGAGGFSMGVSEGSCSNSFGLGELARFVVAVLRYQYADLRCKSSLHDAIQHVLDGKRERHEEEKCAVKKRKHDHNREANCLPVVEKEAVPEKHCCSTKKHGREDNILNAEGVLDPNRVVRVMFPRLDDRSARLYACDCVKHLLHLFECCSDDRRPHKSIEMARRYAKSDATAEAMYKASQAATSIAWDMGTLAGRHSGADLRRYAAAAGVARCAARVGFKERPVDIPAFTIDAARWAGIDVEERKWQSARLFIKSGEGRGCIYRPRKDASCDVKREKRPRMRTWDKYYRDFWELGWPID